MFENRKVLYLTVIDSINGYIKNHNLKPGDQIPSEPQLTRLLNVSRATVRMAIQELVNAGVLEKAQGKGTFVRPPMNGIDINEFLSFSTWAKKMGLKSRSIVARFEKVDSPTHDVVEGLELNPGDSVWVIERHRYIDDEATLLETTYIPHKLFNNFEGKRLAKESIYDVFEGYGFHYLTGQERILPTALTKREADFFGAKENDPAIILIKKMKHYTQVVEYTKAIFKKGKFELTASIVKISL
jgi:GntR family transcriptional regulator